MFHRIAKLEQLLDFDCAACFEAAEEVMAVFCHSCGVRFCGKHKHRHHPGSLDAVTIVLTPGVPVPNR